ncbi:MAG: hypothetical protein EPN48_02880 [Microbacteriaceae bacterium]|nr:MAG: hypothetical protein EPN48_02880 [Microbacteriaceae bacterium]
MPTHSRKKLVGAAVTTAVLTVWMLTPGQEAQAATPFLTVDFSSSTGSPLGGYGRGLLHGINADFPDAANVAPLNPTEWRLGDPGYNGATTTPPYDYFHVYGTTAHYNPAQTEVITSDFIADPTYNPQYANPSATNWNTLCYNVAAGVVAAGQSPTFDLINEPDQGVDGATSTWLSTGSTSWDDCYAGVRSADPSAQIAGPSISYSSVADLETFLSDQSAKGKLPNVLTWHFDAPQTLASDASALRTWMTAHSIAQIPLVLQEALTSGSVGHPGQTVDYFAAAVEGSVTVGHACWGESGLPNGNTCEEPMLDGILNLTQTRRAEWYAYADYAAMAGNAVATSTSDITHIDGLATADPATNKATVLLGANDNYAGGTVNVVLNGLGSLPFIGGAASVRVAVQTLAPGTGAASQPVASDTTYTISSGSATVPISLARYSAARLTIMATSSDVTDSSWANLGGTLSDSPAIASTGSSNLFAFVRGSDGALYASRYNGSSWAAWSGSAWNNTTGAGDIGGPSGGTFVGAPAAVAWGGNVTVTVRGTDNALWIDTLSSAGTWGGWASLGGTLASSPALASQNGSDLEAFARNSSGGVSTTQYNGTSWSSWTSLGGTVIGDPTAVSRSNGVVTVYAKHADNSVWETYWTTVGGWSAWSSIGGNLSSSPNISAESSTEESLFGRGQSGALLRDTWTSTAGWSGWTTVGSGGPTYGTMTGTPATVSRGSGSTDVLVWSSDGPLAYLPTS